MISLILNLTAEHPVQLPTGHGHLVHAWFLDVVRRMHPSLAGHLHDDRGDKPFTLSMIQGGQRRHNNLITFREGDRAALRLTALDEATSEVAAAASGGEVKRVVLAGQEFRVGDCSVEEESFAALAENAARGADASRIKLRFLSPTAFKSDRRRIPFPWPELLVRKLGEKWNVYAPPSLRCDEAYLAAVGALLWIGRYDLRTELLMFPSRSGSRAHPEIGCVGECELVVDDRAALAIGVIARVLVEFAHYAGVGHKTTMGMGQVRSLPGGSR